MKFHRTIVLTGVCTVSLALVVGPAQASTPAPERSAPTGVQPQFGPQAWLSASASGLFTCGIPTDHSLWCWGDNRDGELGNGTVNSGQSGPHVVGTDTDWVDVSNGVDHACGIEDPDGAPRQPARKSQDDTSLFCWGDNDFGQLGVGDEENRSSPTQVSGDTWQAVVTGEAHTCATQSDGSLWCWGADTHGQLGLGGTQTEDTPQQVGTDTDWASVSAGGDHTCGILTDRSLWCWGDNADGELGVGDTSDRFSPTQVGTLTSWVQVSAGATNTCALSANGTLWCWGDSGVGAGSTVPVQIGTVHQWSSVSAGDSDSCATRSNGSLWCWGTAEYGQLGQGNRRQHGKPIQITFQQGWTASTVGSGYVCAIRTDSTLWCWGLGSRGQLGDHSRDPRYLPTPVGVSTHWLTVSGSGGGQTCAISAMPKKDPDLLWCWGVNSDGQVGDGTEHNRSLPVQVDGATTWIDVTGGEAFSCGIQTDETLWCWGDDSEGQLGDGGGQDEDTPTRVGTESTWVSVSAGDDHACGIMDDGSLWCWGDNSDGELGDGTTQDSPVPVQVSDGGPWSAVSAGATHTCAIQSSDSSLWCWGDNTDGELGNGASGGNSTSPVEVVGGGVWSSVDAGGSFTCGIQSDKSLWCWGDNTTGQLGVGDTQDRSAPTQVGDGSNWTDVSSAVDHSCANQVNHTEWCWGRERFGDLGNGIENGEEDSPVQMQYQVNDPWQQSFTFDDRSCAEKSFLECWGSGQNGQLGDGTPIKYEVMPAIVLTVPQ